MPKAVVLTGYGPPDVLVWRDVPLPEPGNDRGIQSRYLSGILFLWARLPPQNPSPGPNEYGIARRHPDPSFLFPSLQIFGVDWCSWLEIFHSFEFRNIHQYTACDHAVFHIIDRVLG